MSIRSVRKTKTTARPYDEFRAGAVPPSPRPRKKSRGSRVSLTRLEVRRGETLLLRIAIANDALAEVGDELGTLIKKIAPSTRTSIVVPTPEVVAPAAPAAPAPTSAEFIVLQQHADDDAAYHASLREHFVEMFSSLCDTSLADALEIARDVRERRAEGGN